MSDILAEAREQVLERGEGLDQDQVLQVLQLPDDRLDELLALAHEVRMRWCGPEVEVEGIISLKTGGCPEDCHFCSQSGLFASPGAQRVAGHPEPGRGRQADRQDRRHRVLHRRRRARTRRAAAGAGRRGHRGDPQRGRHPDRLLAGHADPGAGRAARRRWACTATTTTWRPRGRSSPTSSPPTPGRSAGTPCGWSARPAWRCAAAASSAWARRSSSAPSSPPTSPSSTRTRCR